MSDRTCSVVGCERPVRANGYCKMHNHRLTYSGTLDLTGTCCICNDSIPYKGKGRRQTLCVKPECKSAYEVRKVTEYRKRNPERVRDTKRRSVAKNPEKHEATRRRAHLRREYGITVEEYDEMLAAQGGGCAICGGPQVKRQWLAVDHDHATGEVRGLLCDPCNLAVGLFGDDPSTLQRAIDYLTP